MQRLARNWSPVSWSATPCSVQHDTLGVVSRCRCCRRRCVRCLSSSLISSTSSGAADVSSGLADTDQSPVLEGCGGRVITSRSGPTLVCPYSFLPLLCLSLPACRRSATSGYPHIHIRSADLQRNSSSYPRLSSAGRYRVLRAMPCTTSLRYVPRAVVQLHQREEGQEGVNIHGIANNGGGFNMVNMYIYSAASTTERIRHRAPQASHRAGQVMSTVYSG